MKKMYFLLFLPPLILTGCSLEDDEGSPLPDPQQEVPTTPEEPNKNSEDTEAPSVPSKLLVSEHSFESFKLSWDASSDNVEVTEYEVFLNEASFSNTNGTSQEINDLSPGSTYSLSVRAKDAAGNSSEQSEVLEAATLEDTEPPTIPLNLEATQVTDTSISLSWQASTDNAGILEYELFMGEELVGTTSDMQHQITGLTSETTYSLSLRAKDIYNNLSKKTPPLEVTTLSSSSETSPSALLFSEYIEGSSNNKALELVNLSEAEVDLAGYSLKKISNDQTEWTSEKVLEGILAPGAVFVIAHAKASEDILNLSDMSLGGGIMSFNGNDVIGLFENGKLIDIIGEPGGVEFAQDVTMRRKASVTGPNPEFTPDEWEVFEQDNIEGLGNY